MISKLTTASLKVASVSLCLVFAINSSAHSASLEVGDVIVSDEMNARIFADSENNVFVEAIDANEDVRVEIHGRDGEILVGETRFRDNLLPLSNLLTGPINNLTMVGGRGGDDLLVTAALARSGERVEIMGDLTIDGGNSFDSLGLSGVSVGGKVIIRGRGRGDLIELFYTETDEMYVGGGPGFDSIVLNNIQASGRVALSGGRDNDNCSISNSSFSGRLVLRQLDNGCRGL